MTYTLGDIAQRVGADVVGNEALTIVAVNTLQEGEAGELGFLVNPKYRAQLNSTRLSAVVVSPADVSALSEAGLSGLVHKNPYATFARVAALFDTAPAVADGIDPSAKIADNAVLANHVSIAAGAVIRQGAELGEGVKIGANSVIGEGVSIGAHTIIEANVSIYHAVSIGCHCRIHSGSVIGADGFGWAPEEGDWVKVPQLGRVLIADHVDIGANCCVDRGTLGDTVIEQGVKLDNLVQIAHNVRVGAFSVIAAKSGIAGSASLGHHVVMGGDAGVAGHISVADGTLLTGRAMVLDNVTEKGSYSGGVPLMPTIQWKKSMVRLQKLDEMARTVRKLEKKIAELEAGDAKEN